MIHTFTYRWYEKNQEYPFQIHGDALCIYRASIMIARKHTQGEILNDQGQLATTDELFTQVSKIVILSTFPKNCPSCSTPVSIYESNTQNHISLWPACSCGWTGIPQKLPNLP